MQRLFSSFANGWPGKGLLLQRLLTSGGLSYLVLTHLGTTAPLVTLLYCAGGAAGLLLLAGLWTPLAGTMVALLELCIIVVGGGDVLISVTLATLGASLAMIGPGAWSLDARLFGRKHIDPIEG